MGRGRRGLPGVIWYWDALLRGSGNWSGAGVFEAEPLEDTMTRIAILTLTAAALALAACGATVEQKAATGAVAGAVVAGPVGAAVGGAAGTAAGHAQKPN